MRGSRVNSRSPQPFLQTSVLEHFERRLAGIDCQDGRSLVAGGLFGLEKESLRVASDGVLSQKAHPASLGAPLAHPWVTTDYSEALLELITPPMTNSTAVLDFLGDLQTWAYGHLEEELLWATSMPCVVAGESHIPIARYGTSNAGLMKHIYRVGLGHRYGRVMQVIAGVHVNYSVPEGLWPLLQEIDGDTGIARAYVDDAYMGLVRNLQRWGWLVPYLFGASPAICRSFFGDRQVNMPLFDEGTYYEPFATSLRMGDIGYQNQKEEAVGIKACYDSVDSYAASLERAITTPAERWQRIGVRTGDEWHQLNANILQIENEYYSTVRPKQLLEGLEKPTLALRKRGIRYVELRSPDVNAFDPLGIDGVQLRFLELLFLFCLLAESPRIRQQEAREIDLNLQRTAHQGRKPGLQLVSDGRELALRSWSGDLLDAMEPLAELLDRAVDGNEYRQSLAQQRAKVDDPSATPSARMLAEMRTNGESFHAFAWRLSRQHQRYFLSRGLDEAVVRRLEEQAAQSHARQAEIEAEAGMPFGEFLQRYFDQA
jgi:glutamate--cysteine ligase